MKHLFKKGSQNLAKRPEIRRKISEAKKGKSTWNKGKHLSQKWRENISKALKGKQLSEIHKKKIAEKSVFQKGQNHINWQGGKSFEPYSIEWTKTLRKKIKKRDNFICQLCSKTEKEQNQTDKLKRGLTVHHIDYNKKNCNLDNLILLCRRCHSFTHFNRKDWKQKLTQIMKFK